MIRTVPPNDGSDVRPAVMTTHDAAAESTLCQKSILNAIKRGELRARKLGRRTVILRRDFEQWLEQAPLAAAAE